MRRNFPLLGFLILIIVLLNLTSLIKKQSEDKYFSSTSVPDDVWDQYFYIRKFIQQPIDHFNGFEQIPRKKWKLQLAFFSYSITSLAIVDSNFVNEAQEMFDKILYKMLGSNISEDDSEPEYQVHLSLMLNLYQYVTGKTTFIEQNQKTTLDLFEKLSQPNLDSFRFSSTDISVALLSFFIYDKLNRASLSELTESWLQKFRSEKWTKPQIAWNIIFLSAITDSFSQQLYQNFKEEHFEEFTKISMSKKDSTNLWPVNKNLVYAATSARAMNDTSGFSQLINIVSRVGNPTYKGNNLYFSNSNLLGDTIILFSKVCRFSELLLIEPSIFTPSI
jgi:hypothetical protein